MSKPAHVTFVTLLIITGAAACGTDRDVAGPEPTGFQASSLPSETRFAGWCAPTNLGPTINSAAADNGPMLSRDGLTLFFASQRAGGAGLPDLWVATRASIDAPWQAPVNLAMLNGPRIDAGPSLSVDEHVLYFTSDRPSPFPETGSLDIWMSHRTDVNDPMGWSAPVNLGAPVNSAQPEIGPDSWGPYLFFSRGLGPGTPPLPPGVPLTPLDLYVARGSAAGFDEPVELTILNSPEIDQRPSVRFDGREIYYASTREGGQGQEDLYVATRIGSGLPWSAPVPVADLNTASRESQPSLSSDGMMLFFISDRAGGSGNFDLWVAKRRSGMEGGGCG